MRLPRCALLTAFPRSFFLRTSQGGADKQGPNLHGLFGRDAKMVFAGLKKKGDRANLVAYLAEATGAPTPIPEGGRS